MAEEFSPSVIYCGREIFEEKHNEGYTEAAFGEGNWVRDKRMVKDKRIISLLAFFNPNRLLRRVATYELPEFNCGILKVHGNHFESTYNTEWTFRRYCERNEITISNRQNLSDILEHW